MIIFVLSFAVQIGLYKHLRFFLIAIVCLICMHSSSLGLGSLCWTQAQLPLKEKKENSSVIKQEHFHCFNSFFFFLNSKPNEEFWNLGVRGWECTGRSHGFITLWGWMVTACCPLFFPFSGQDRLLIIISKIIWQSYSSFFHMHA